jgi:DNA-binding beta-propeller fold protein YncE
MVRRRALSLLPLAAAFAAFLSQPALADPLNKVGSIDLGNTPGAITALTLDYANQRLFVLQGDAGRLSVVDLAASKVSQTIDKLVAPTGMARAPTENRLYIGTGDGKVAVYAGVPLAPENGIALGPDLGALQYDASNERVYLPFGAKKFAILDATHNKHWNDIRLDGRPGAFALEEGGTRAFVAAVGEKRIMIADREGNKQTGSWPTGDYGDAASLAPDEDAGRLIVAFRQPAAIAWFDLADGSMKGHADACAKPGQVLADSSRSAVYLTCGDGMIETFKRDASGNYAKSGSMNTAPGATAALLVPLSGRVYLGVPPANGQPAEIRIYDPAS